MARQKKKRKVTTPAEKDNRQPAVCGNCCAAYSSCEEYLESKPLIGKLHCSVRTCTVLNGCPLCVKTCQKCEASSCNTCRALSMCCNDSTKQKSDPLPMEEKKPVARPIQDRSFKDRWISGRSPNTPEKYTPYSPSYDSGYSPLSPPPPMYSPTDPTSSPLAPLWSFDSEQEENDNFCTCDDSVLEKKEEPRPYTCYGPNCGKKMTFQESWTCNGLNYDCERYLCSKHNYRCESCDLDQCEEHCRNHYACEPTIFDKLKKNKMEQGKQAWLKFCNDVALLKKEESLQ